MYLATGFQYALPILYLSLNHWSLLNPRRFQLSGLLLLQPLSSDVVAVG
jgi:hypothetical protein